MQWMYGLEQIKLLLKVYILENNDSSILFFFLLSFLYPLIKHLQIFPGLCSLGSPYNYYHFDQKKKKGCNLKVTGYYCNEL